MQNSGRRFMGSFSNTMVSILMVLCMLFWQDVFLHTVFTIEVFFYAIVKKMCSAPDVVLVAVVYM